MSKVIKRSSTADIGQPVAMPDTQPVATHRRKGVIDKDIYDAKTEAQRILQSAHEQAQLIIQQAQTQAKTILDEAAVDAQHIVPNAQAQAEQIMSQAQQEAEQLKSQAHQNGYQEGKEQGATQVSEMLATQTKLFNEMMENLEPQMLQLTMTILKKILGEEGDEHQDIVVKVTKRALKTVRQRREITIRANPEDVEVLRAQKREILDVLSRTKEIAFEEDPGISRGGVLIETEAGRIDARLETQLAVFENIFNTQGS